MRRVRALFDGHRGPVGGGKGMSVELYDPDEYSIWTEYDIARGTRSFRWVVSGGDGGEHYVRVWGGQGAYEWTATVTPQDDAGSGGDAADEMDDAIEIALERVRRPAGRQRAVRLVHLQSERGKVRHGDADRWQGRGVP